MPVAEPQVNQCESLDSIEQSEPVFQEKSLEEIPNVDSFPYKEDDIEETADDSDKLEKLEQEPTNFHSQAETSNENIPDDGEIEKEVLKYDRQELEELKTKLNVINLTKKLERLEIEFQHRTTELHSKYQKEISELRSEHQKTITDLRDEKKTMKIAESALKSEVNNLKVEIENLKQSPFELSNARKEIKNLQDQIKGLEATAIKNEEESAKEKAVVISFSKQKCKDLRDKHKQKLKVFCL